MSPDLPLPADMTVTAKEFLEQGEEIIRSVDRLNTNLKRTWAVGLVIVLLLVLVIADNRTQISTLKRQTCRAFNAIGYNPTPPADGEAGDRSRAISREFRDLTRTFGCPLPSQVQP